MGAGHGEMSALTAGMIDRCHAGIALLMNTTPSWQWHTIYVPELEGDLTGREEYKFMYKHPDHIPKSASSKSKT